MTISVILAKLPPDLIPASKSDIFWLFQQYIHNARSMLSSIRMHLVNGFDEIQDRFDSILQLSL